MISHVWKEQEAIHAMLQNASQWSVRTVRKSNRLEEYSLSFCACDAISCLLTHTNGYNIISFHLYYFFEINFHLQYIVRDFGYS